MIPGTPTRVDAVISALLELLPPLMPSGVKVLDGDPPGAANENEAVAIAPADPDTPGILVRRGKDPGLGNAFVEEVEVAIVGRSFIGDEDMRSRRQRCLLMVGAVEQLVREKQRHEGAWDQIQLGAQMTWHPVYTTKGSNCFVGLSIVATGLL